MRYRSVEGCAGGMIVETEAYLGEEDQASHARFGPTSRSVVMFGKPGVAYVYLVYGLHFLFNVVTEAEGVAGAVLIRALQPLEGIGLMKRRRGLGERSRLTDGPAKLTEALGITLDNNNQDLTSGRLGVWQGEDDKSHPIKATPRVGVVGYREKEWRFLIEGNEYVSR